MKKTCLLFLLITFHCSLLFGAPVDFFTAEQVAFNWLSRQNDIKGNSFEISLKGHQVYQAKGYDIFFFINYFPEGWVIVSADDSAYPIVGYNFSCTIDTESMNCNTRDFLLIHVKSIIYIIENGLDNKYTRPEWDNILQGFFDDIDGRGKVLPLLTTKWNQNYPWNAMCPQDPDGHGGHVYAGCVAVAMVQVMKYWSHPDQGTGSHSYYHSTYGTLSADFGNTVYDWNNMPDLSATESTQELLFHAGVSVNMNYGPNGSGAFGHNARNAMEQYFKFDPSISFVNRSSYSVNNWINLLKSQLNSGMPMYYQGYGSAGGHAFNCDGYDQNDLFHFNWGWGGAFDGYFNINNLNPGPYTFNNNQSAIINMFPIGVQNPVSFTAIGVSTSQIDLNWQKNQDNDSVMLVYSESGIFGIPIDGDIYDVGTAIPGGGTVIHRGGITSFSHTNLNSATMYYYKAFSYNSSCQYSQGITANASTMCDIFTSLPFSENFNSSFELPDCWQIMDHQGNGQVWQFGVISGGLSNTTGNYAYLNSDDYGYNNTQNTDLITPAFDLSGYENITLEFTHYLRIWQSETATLSYSTDNGKQWEILATWTSTTANPAYFSQSIPDLSGQQFVRFKWNYTGTWGYYWCIDDIMINGDPVVQYYEVRLHSSHPDANVVLAGHGDYSAGQLVVIEAHSDTLAFVEWTGTSEHTALLDNSYSQTASFIMPSHDVEFTAVFTGPSTESIFALISLENPSVTGIWKWSYDNFDKPHIKTKGPSSNNYRAFSTWDNLISGITSRKMIAADLSNDGTPELIMLIPDFGLWVYNFYSGMFTVVTNECSDFTIARTSRNGQRQIIFSNNEGTYIWDYLNNLDSLIINVTAETLLSTDFYRNGIDELIVGFRGINRLYTYCFAENSFTAITLVKPTGMTSGDITGDGHDELICSFEGFGIYLIKYVPGQHKIKRPVNGKISFDHISNLTHNEWSSINKGVHVQRLTYADPMSGHCMITGNIAFGNSSELIVSIEGRTYYYSYANGWRTLTFKPMKTIITGKFTGNHKDDLIACESHGGNIYLRESASGQWYLLVNGGDSNAMTPMFHY